MNTILPPLPTLPSLPSLPSRYRANHVLKSFQFQVEPDTSRFTNPRLLYAWNIKNKNTLVQPQLTEFVSEREFRKNNMFESINPFILFFCSNQHKRPNNCQNWPGKVLKVPFLKKGYSDSVIRFSLTVHCTLLILNETKKKYGLQ